MALEHNRPEIRARVQESRALGRHIEGALNLLKVPTLFWNAHPPAQQVECSAH